MDQKLVPRAASARTLSDIVTILGREARQFSGRLRYLASYIVKAEGVVFLRGFRSHARQSVDESQEHYVWLRLRRASNSQFRLLGVVFVGPAEDSRAYRYREIRLMRPRTDPASIFLMILIR